MDEIKDNVIELRRVKASELIPNPRNWRTHPEYQRQAFATILDTIGITDALLARETPEGLMLIDGHLRADMMPDQLVPVLVVDLDEAQADIALGTHDVIGNLAQQEQARLDVLIDRLSHPDPDAESAIRALVALQRDEYRALEPLADPEITEYPGLNDGDRSLIGQMTFTVTGDQKAMIEEALRQSKHAGEFVDTGNENSNGNALARICETFASVVANHE